LVIHILLPVAATFGAQLHPHHVRAGAGFAHRERAEVLAADELRQVSTLLPGRTPAMDLVDAEVGVRAVGEPDRARRAADFLDRDDVREVPHAGPAPLGTDGDAVQAEVAELRPEVARELVAVDLVGPAGNLARREGAHRFAQQVDVLAKAEIEVEHRRGPRGLPWSVVGVYCPTIGLFVNCGVQPVRPVPRPPPREPDPREPLQP
jgi:hypothetical protein